MSPQRAPEFAKRFGFSPEDIQELLARDGDDIDHYKVVVSWGFLDENLQVVLWSNIEFNWDPPQIKKSATGDLRNLIVNNIRSKKRNGYFPSMHIKSITAIKTFNDSFTDGVDLSVLDPRSELARSGEDEFNNSVFNGVDITAGIENANNRNPQPIANVEEEAIPLPALANPAQEHEVEITPPPLANQGQQVVNVINQQTPTFSNDINLLHPDPVNYGIDQTSAPIIHTEHQPQVYVEAPAQNRNNFNYFQSQWGYNTQYNSLSQIQYQPMPYNFRSNYYYPNAYYHPSMQNYYQTTPLPPFNNQSSRMATSVPVQSELPQQPMVSPALSQANLINQASVSSDHPQQTSAVVNTTTNRPPSVMVSSTPQLPVTPTPEQASVITQHVSIPTLQTVNNMQQDSPAHGSANNTLKHSSISPHDQNNESRDVVDLSEDGSFNDSCPLTHCDHDVITLTSTPSIQEISNVSPESPKVSPIHDNKEIYDVIQQCYRHPDEPTNNLLDFHPDLDNTQSLLDHVMASPTERSPRDSPTPFFTQRSPSSRNSIIIEEEDLLTINRNDINSPQPSQPAKSILTERKVSNITCNSSNFNFSIALTNITDTTT